MAKKILIPDTTKVSREEWLEWRKNGIGGSDAAVILGISPWKTPLQLYGEKVFGYEENREAESEVPLRAGNALELLIIKLAERLTGMTIKPAKEMVCIEDKPHITANPDAFAYPSEGKKAIVEIKTFNRRMTDEKWGDNTIPPYYESQLRQYQGVYDDEVSDTAYFFALPIDEEERMLAAMFAGANYEFSEEDIDLAEKLFASRLITRTITRDKDYEEAMFAVETDFWNNYVVPQVEPPVLGNGTLNKNYLLSLDRDEDQTVLDEDATQILDEYNELSEKKKALKKQIDDIENQSDGCLAKLIALMGSSQSAVIHKEGTHGYELTIKPGVSRTGISSENLQKLKLQFPDAYNEFVKTSVGKNRVAIKEIKMKKKKSA